MSALRSGDGVEVTPVTVSADMEQPATVISEGDSHMRSGAGTATSQHADKPRGKVCGVCNDHEARYKCSRCELPYCSVACATLHRTTHPAVSDDAPPTIVDVEPPAATNGLAAKPTSDALPAVGSQNPFSVLDGAKELQTLFMMYPRLRSQLRDIYAATLPPVDEPTGMIGHYEDHAQSYRGRGRGRSRGGRGRDRGPWNADRGTQDGIDALCNAKDQYGKGGEGIREYAELVLKLISMEGVDVAQLVQEEVAEENAKIIAQLLNGDSY